MKTTLKIDDTVMRQLKREAMRQGRTMSELVETALKDTLDYLVGVLKNLGFRVGFIHQQRRGLRQSHPYAAALSLVLIFCLS